MASYAQELAKRFGDQNGPTDLTLPEIAFLRQVLARKTVRSYQDVVPSDSLLDLICAAALSTSTKSDFQQASILRVLERAEANAPWRAVSGHAVDRIGTRVFRVFG